MSRAWTAILSLLVFLPGFGAASYAPPADPWSPANAHEAVQTGLVAFEPWELVMAVAWSPDGEVLALSAGDRLYLLDAAGLDVLATFRIGAFTHSLAFSPDSRLLASGSRDGSVRLWDVTAELASGGAGQPVLDILAHRNGANSVAFSPDGQVLASAGNDAVARFWEIPGGEALGHIIGGTYSVPGMAFSRDGAILALVNGSLVRMREVDSQRIAGTLRMEGVLFSIGFSPDGRWLAVGDNNNSVWLWEAKTALSHGVDSSTAAGKLEGHTGIPGNYTALVWDLAFNPAGDLLVSAGGDGTLRLWNVDSREPLGVLQGHTRGVTCLAFSPDGSRLASGGLDGTLRLWELK